MATTPLQGLPVPSLADAPNGPAQFLSFGSAIEKLLVMRFATVAARDAAIPAPTAGMECYTVAEDTFWFHNGTAWSSRYQPVSPAWTNATLLGTWVNLGGAFQSVQYRKIGTDVEVRGAATGGAINSNIFTFPAGFIPIQTQTYMYYSAPLRVDVLNTGNVLFNCNTAGLAVLNFRFSLL